MAGLMYREDMDEVRARLTAWWNGGDLGRPALQLTAPRAEPLERIAPMPQPPGWTGRYSTKSFAYRVHISQTDCVKTHYLAEAVPTVAPHLAPNCLALFLGCRGREMPNTVWCEPFIDDPDAARFQYDPANFYWEFARRLGREQLRVGRGKFLVEFCDLIEGFDTLAAMRGTEPLLMDILERPDWVRACLRQITDRYFHYYDMLYDMIRDEVGGSSFWAWAPGRMAKFQCDFSAMISPTTFGEFMVPVLTEMSERVSYCMFHWDGPGAIKHHDHLLSIPRLTMIQWTPGAGVEPVCHPRWWPLYHKTLDAGKKLILLGCRGADDLRAIKREFGAKLKNCMIRIHVRTLDEAAEIMKLAKV